ncbi:MAG: U32 family peptidase [Hornefia sp.]|nr:U32 family peptidase [Hornefia sp.]
MYGKKRIELLAPAGGIEQLISAVENGADAVYLGGRVFNARMKAGNFDDNTLVKAVDFAHKRGVEVHVTMNILLSDDELGEALDYAGFLYGAGVDAVIVQDLGLASLIHKNMPDFPLHLSTQGTVYSLDGVKTAERMGFSRVVLSRELSYEDIKYICSNTDVEIETFIHGAICICYSGQCQLSRYFGKRSGNRGECAQPCRLKYDSFDEDEKLIERGTHPLSPKDQSLIDHLGELAEAGVTSLKIEGRMKSAEYVGIVAGIYRKYLDEYYEKGHYVVSREDREALEQIFNRGGLTDEYFKGNSDDRLMSKDIPKHSGVLIGEVERRVKGSGLIDIKLFKELSLGDGIEIRPRGGKHDGQKFVGNIVTYYEKEEKLVRIGDLKGRVHKGDLIYRISGKEQLEGIRRSYKGISLDGTGKERRKTLIDIEVTAEDEKIKVRAKHPKGIFCEVELDAAGSDRKLNIEKFEVSMRKTGNTPFEIANMKFPKEDIYIDLKVSEMNGIRRNLLEKLQEDLVLRRKRADMKYSRRTAPATPRRFERYYYNWESYRKHRDEEIPTELPVYDIIPIIDFEEHFEEVKDKNVIPYISNVAKGKEEIYIKDNLKRICDHCKDCGIYVGNISLIEIFRGKGIRLYGDYGLNVYNEETKNYFKSFGIDICAGSLEKMDAGNGRYPLMIMEHGMKEKLLRGKMDREIETFVRKGTDKTIVAAKKAGGLKLNKIRRDGDIVRYYF